MTRHELMKKAAECDLGRVVGPLETLLDEEWESLHRFVDYCLRAEMEALRAERDTAVGTTALRCIEMAKWPQGIDDEQAFYGRMFAEFIEREFRAAIDAAKGGA